MADQSALSSRSIIGTYFRLLQQDTGVAWVDQISNLFGSDQPSEDYKFLGMAPAMQEWIGGRQIDSLNIEGITLTNVHYQAGLEIRVRDARRDKTPQIEARLADLVQRQQAHWGSLLSTLIENGETGVCYDGQFFFDTDHTEGSNTTNQSNDIDVNISEIPSQVAGVIANPSNEEMQGTILQAITQMLSFVDDRGEPMNEMASEFVVMTLPALWPAAAAATRSAAQDHAFDCRPIRRSSGQRVHHHHRCRPPARRLHRSAELQSTGQVARGLDHRSRAASRRGHQIRGRPGDRGLDQGLLSRGFDRHTDGRCWGRAAARSSRLLRDLHGRCLLSAYRHAEDHRCGCRG